MVAPAWWAPVIFSRRPEVDNPVERVENMKNIYVRLLQFLVGTEPDGDFGPASCAAADRLINELRGMAGDFYKFVLREEVRKEDGEC